MANVSRIPNANIDRVKRYHKYSKTCYYLQNEAVSDVGFLSFWLQYIDTCTRDKKMQPGRKYEKTKTALLKKDSKWNGMKF